MWNSQSYVVREGSESLQYGLVTMSQYERKEKKGQEHVIQKTVVYKYIIVMYHKSSFI